MPRGRKPDENRTFTEEERKNILANVPNIIEAFKNDYAMSSRYTEEVMERVHKKIKK